MRTRTHLPLYAIVLLALALRLHGWIWIEHNVDQAYPIGQALATLQRGTFPLLGQATSVLFANPPLAGYLYLPIAVAWPSPVPVTLAVIALNSVGVLLAADAVRRIGGGWAAVIAGGLLAVNPWLIEYSRATWVQGLLPFYACALAWLLWPLLTRRTRQPGTRWIAACAIFALAAGSYLLAYALLVPVSLWLLTARPALRTIPRRALFTGLLIIIVPALVYAAALVTSPAAGDRLATFTGGALRVSAEAWDHAVRLVTGAEYPSARGTEAAIADAALRETLTTVAHVLILGLIALGAAGVFRRERRLITALPLISFLAPVLLLTITPQIVHPFYLLIGVPGGAALAGLGGDMLRRASPGRLRPVVTAGLLGGLLALTGLHAVSSARFAQVTALTPGAHGLGALPLAYQPLLHDWFAQYLATYPDAAVFADVDEWTLTSFTGRVFASFWRDLDRERLLILPAAGGLYLETLPPNASASADSPSAWPPVLWTGWHAFPDGGTLRARFYTAADWPTLAGLLNMPPLDASSALTGTVDGQPAFDLIGWRMTETRETVELLLVWAVRGEHPDRLFAPFAHVFDAAGQRVAIVDGVAVPGYVLRVGDVHLHRLTFARPAGNFTIAVGQYDGGAGVGVLFAGQPTIPLAD